MGTCHVISFAGDKGAVGDIGDQGIMGKIGPIGRKGRFAFNTFGMCCDGTEQNVEHLLFTLPKLNRWLLLPKKKRKS